jgi:Rhodopirellula transposase DDE domain
LTYGPPAVFEPALPPPEAGRTRDRRRLPAPYLGDEGAQHPDRDAQFRYLNDHAKAYQATGDPVVSVDTKKKELVGAFKERRPAVAPER